MDKEIVVQRGLIKRVKNLLEDYRAFKVYMEDKDLNMEEAIEELKGKDRLFNKKLIAWKLKDFYDSIRSNYKETLLMQKLILKKIDRGSL